jgi:hypothetical protein
VPCLSVVFAASGENARLLEEIGTQTTVACLRISKSLSIAMRSTAVFVVFFLMCVAAIAAGKSKGGDALGKLLKEGRAARSNQDVQVCRWLSVCACVRGTLCFQSFIQGACAGCRGQVC